jgi:hypothetical protein
LTIIATEMIGALLRFVKLKDIFPSKTVCRRMEFLFAEIHIRDLFLKPYSIIFASHMSNWSLDRLFKKSDSSIRTCRVDLFQMKTRV